MMLTFEDLKGDFKKKTVVRWKAEFKAAVNRICSSDETEETAGEKNQKKICRVVSGSLVIVWLFIKGIVLFPLHTFKFIFYTIPSHFIKKFNALSEISREVIKIHIFLFASIVLIYIGIQQIKIGDYYALAIGLILGGVCLVLYVLSFKSYKLIRKRIENERIEKENNQTVEEETANFDA